MTRYDAQTTTLGTLLEDPDVVAIIDQHAPGMRSNPLLGSVLSMPAAQAMGMAGAVIGADKANAIKADVEALEPRTD
ncbi:MAG: hypothetical protein ACRCXL_04630 [Dermatophilaceae bacterium]